MNKIPPPSSGSQHPRTLKDPGDGPLLLADLLRAPLTLEANSAIGDILREWLHSAEPRGHA